MATELAWNDVLSPVATLIGVLAAGLGVALNLRRTRLNQESRQAFDAYNAYITDCLANPELASGEVKLPKDDQVGWTQKFYKYQWLVARFLGAAEETLRASPKSEKGGWYRAIKGDAKWHEQYFSSPFFTVDEYAMYSKDVRNIIRDVISDKKKRADLLLQDAKLKNSGE